MTATPDAPLQSRAMDDKSPICIPFILDRLRIHRAGDGSTATGPFIIGLNGVQGVGKTTLVKALAEILEDREGLRTVVVSIDDFYLKHDDQLALAAAHPDNALVQCRGEPGTHDIPLALQFLESLCNGSPTRIPQYDKSAFSGLGDRPPESRWEPVNGPGQRPVQVVILEGWCVGFRPLDRATVEAKWRAPSRTLHGHKLEHLLFINDQLRAYDAITDMFTVFIHIDAEDTEYVYAWRQEQEELLRAERGTGMTDEQVVKFVDAYYPAYELFSDSLRDGIFPGRPGNQLRLLVRKDRSVKKYVVI